MAAPVHVDLQTHTVDIPLNPIVIIDDSEEKAPCWLCALHLKNRKELLK